MRRTILVQILLPLIFVSSSSNATDCERATALKSLIVGTQRLRLLPMDQCLVTTSQLCETLKQDFSAVRFEDQRLVEMHTQLIESVNGIISQANEAARSETCQNFLLYGDKGDAMEFSGMINDVLVQFDSVDGRLGDLVRKACL